MKLMQMLNCKMGRHARDRAKVRHDGHVFRSVCKGCGLPMFRDLDEWLPARSNGAADSPALRLLDSAER
jgi:hypothetical protein